MTPQLTPKQALANFKEAIRKHTHCDQDYGLWYIEQSNLKDLIAELERDLASVPTQPNPDF